MTYEKNVGTFDRVIRMLLGGILLWVGIDTRNWSEFGIGVILLLTGIIGYCILYRLLRISTCPR